MSKPRYKWWSYVKWMIRLYPERVKVMDERMSAKLTANYDAMPRSGQPGRTTENLGTVTLGKTVDREVEAVRRAICDTAQMRDGLARLRLIDLVYWQKTYKLDSVGIAIAVSDRTVQRWHGDFIRAVAGHFGLLE